MRGIGVASVTTMNDRLGGYDRKVLCLLRAPIPRNKNQRRENDKLRHGLTVLVMERKYFSRSKWIHQSCC